MSNLTSVIFPIAVSLLLGGLFYFLISSLVLENVIKMVITLVVIFAAYTLLAEATQSKYTD